MRSVCQRRFYKSRGNLVQKSAEIKIILSDFSIPMPTYEEVYGWRSPAALVQNRSSSR